MKRVTGLGGIFFKSDDPKALYAWYERHLGIRSNPDGTGTAFAWRGHRGPAEKRYDGVERIPARDAIFQS